jgi:hypothetical protein
MQNRVKVSFRLVPDRESEGMVPCAAGRWSAPHRHNRVAAVPKEDAMRSAMTRVAWFALAVVAAAALYAVTETRAQTAKPMPATTPTQMPASNSTMHSGAPNLAPTQLPADDPATKAANDSRKAQIKTLDDQIHALREQYKAELDPLNAQVKSVHDKYDGQIKDLEAQRKTLVEAGEPPLLRQLNDEESTQLSALNDQEKAELDKVRENYSNQKKTLQASFQQRRHELLLAKQ